MEFITGGVCAPAGFSASGIHCGIRKNHSKKDLALIFSAIKANAAAIYTKNRVKGAPLTVTKRHLSHGRARAVICNSGNANACTPDGVEVAETIARLAAERLGISQNEVIVASTGVIGQRLDPAPIRVGIPLLVSSLGENSLDAANAIMTTDTIVKEAAVTFKLGGAECRLGGIAKGSGMIHPNMATMLVFLTTDAEITPRLLKEAVAEDAKDSFNMISVDGDTSTNDMVAIMANGLSGATPITSRGKDYDTFVSALGLVTKKLCRLIAGDGEGATKLLECLVTGAGDKKTARLAARAVVGSSLVKAAMFGSDANSGRVLCAVGYSGGNVDTAKVSVAFESEYGSIDVCRDGVGISFSEEKAKRVLTGREIKIIVGLGGGSESAAAWGCDLSYDYVRINGDYRT
ncbi:MAG: bifunctional glutamate N-acetyltransferase/amino-acid acetyltransferase ArgJ [Eubacteriales bacterium]